MLRRELELLAAFLDRHLERRFLAQSANDILGGSNALSGISTNGSINSGASFLAPHSVAMQQQQQQQQRQQQSSPPPQPQQRSIARATSSEASAITSSASAPSSSYTLSSALESPAHALTPSSPLSASWVLPPSRVGELIRSAERMMDLPQQPSQPFSNQPTSPLLLPITNSQTLSSPRTAATRPTTPPPSAAIATSSPTSPSSAPSTPQRSTLATTITTTTTNLSLSDTRFPSVHDGGDDDDDDQDDDQDDDKHNEEHDHDILALEADHANIVTTHERPHDTLDDNDNYNDDNDDNDDDDDDDQHVLQFEGFQSQNADSRASSQPSSPPNGTAASAASELLDLGHTPMSADLSPRIDDTPPSPRTTGDSRTVTSRTSATVTLARGSTKLLLSEESFGDADGLSLNETTSAQMSSASQRDDEWPGARLRSAVLDIEEATLTQTSSSLSVSRSGRSADSMASLASTAATNSSSSANCNTTIAPSGPVGDELVQSNSDLLTPSSSDFIELTPCDDEYNLVDADGSFNLATPDYSQGTEDDESLDDSGSNDFEASYASDSPSASATNAAPLMDSTLAMRTHRRKSTSLNSRGGRADHLRAMHRLSIRSPVRNKSLADLSQLTAHHCMYGDTSSSSPRSSATTPSSSHAQATLRTSSSIDSITRTKAQTTAAATPIVTGNWIKSERVNRQRIAPLLKQPTDNHGAGGDDDHHHQEIWDNVPRKRTGGEILKLQILLPEGGSTVLECFEVLTAAPTNTPLRRVCVCACVSCLSTQSSSHCYRMHQ
jgi:hypothetical protein